LAGLALAWPAFAQTDQLGVRLGQGAGSTRVVVDSAGPLSLSPSAAADGTLTVTLVGASITDPETGGGMGRVKDWRLEPTRRGARLVLDVEGGPRIKTRFSIPPDASHPGWRYVIDLADGGGSDDGQPSSVSVASKARLPAIGETSAAAPMAQTDAPPIHSSRTGRAKLAARSAEKKVIVIDAGHGGHDPGARGPDANEKDVTLAAALQLRRRLLRDGAYKVVMTRSDDTFIPLEERVRIARRAGADLFIALHADSAGDNDAPHGASVYTLSGHGETRVNEVLDGHEWFERAAPRSDPGVKNILLDLTQRSTLNRSSVFAQILVDRISQKIDVLPRTHRDASYFVLLAPDVPAVLLEMGFITSREDEARLTDPTRRGELMEAVAAAIDSYFRGDVVMAAN
jgi:N-acetylmuramoyl-L-alanine amidase